MGNGYEQIPFDLILAWGSVFLGNSNNAELQRKLIIGYTVFRAAHTICYIAKLQPFRTIVWDGSKVCIGLLVYGAYKNLTA